jgi:hypothetical protein
VFLAEVVGIELGQRRAVPIEGLLKRDRCRMTRLLQQEFDAIGRVGRNQDQPVGAGMSCLITKPRMSV